MCRWWCVHAVYFPQSFRSFETRFIVNSSISMRGSPFRVRQLYIECNKLGVFSHSRSWRDGANHFLLQPIMDSNCTVGNRDKENIPIELFCEYGQSKTRWQYQGSQDGLRTNPGHRESACSDLIWLQHDRIAISDLIDDIPSRAEL